MVLKGRLLLYTQLSSHGALDLCRQRILYTHKHTSKFEDEKIRLNILVLYINLHCSLSFLSTFLVHFVPLVTCNMFLDSCSLLVAATQNSSVCFSHHGVEAVGEVPSHPGRRGVFIAELSDLLLGLMEHLHTLCIPVRQLVQL